MTDPKDWHGAKGWEQQAIGWGKYKNEPITENVIRKEQPDNNTRLWY